MALRGSWCVIGHLTNVLIHKVSKDPYGPEWAVSLIKPIASNAVEINARYMFQSRDFT